MPQAMIRAGVKTKEETKMARIKSKGNFKFPGYINEPLHFHNTEYCSQPKYHNEKLVI